MRQTKQNGRKRFRKKSTRRLRKKRAMKGGEGCDSVNKPEALKLKTYYGMELSQKICYGEIQKSLKRFLELLDSWKSQCIVDDSQNNENKTNIFDLIPKIMSRIKTDIIDKANKEHNEILLKILLSLCNFYVYSNETEEKLSVAKELILSILSFLNDKISETPETLETLFQETITEMKTEKETYKENRTKIIEYTKLKNLCLQEGSNATGNRQSLCFNKYNNILPTINGIKIIHLEDLPHPLKSL